MEWRDDGVRAGGAPARRERADRRAADRASTAAMPGWCAAGSRRKRRALSAARQRRRRAPGAARLAEHLGTFACELVRGLCRARCSTIPTRLAGLAAAAALAAAALPEREPHPRALSPASRRCSTRSRPIAAGPSAYVGWERGAARRARLRSRSRRAAPPPATTADLAYVSPHTGRAVSRGGRRALSRQAVAAAAVSLPGGNAPPAPQDRSPASL